MAPRKHHQTTRAKKPVQTSDSVFFYLPNEVPYGIFSQWYSSPICLPSASLSWLTESSPSLSAAKDILERQGKTLTISCAEQLYMYCKAMYFGDAECCTRILRTPDPKDQKKLGQKVKGFNDYEWTRVKFRVAIVGNWYKFRDNLQLKGVLLATKERELCEASRKDRVWGIGFNALEADEHRSEWGKSLLGKAIMRVRARLKKLSKEEAEGETVNWDWDGDENETEDEGTVEEEDVTETAGSDRWEQGYGVH